MKDETGNSVDELLKWIISLDRWYVLIETMKEHTVVKASDVAHETSRSTQNISRALNEL
jgi:hypothetical protein